MCMQPSLLPYRSIPCAHTQTGLVVGALGALHCTRLVARRPGAFLGVTSLARALALALAAAFALADFLTLPSALNVVAAALYALQRAAGNAQLAQAVSAASDSDRFPLLFSANQLLASGGASAIGSSGALAGWSANNFYACAAAMALLLALVSPCLGRRPDEQGTVLGTLPVLEGDGLGDGSVVEGTVGSVSRPPEFAPHRGLVEEPSNGAPSDSTSLAVAAVVPHM